MKAEAKISQLFPLGAERLHSSLATSQTCRVRIIVGRVGVLALGRRSNIIPLRIMPE